MKLARAFSMGFHVGNVTEQIHRIEAVAEGLGDRAPWLDRAADRSGAAADHLSSGSPKVTLSAAFREPAKSAPARSRGDEGAPVADTGGVRVRVPLPTRENPWEHWGVGRSVCRMGTKWVRATAGTVRLPSPRRRRA